MKAATISVVVPVLNEGELPELLTHLRQFSFKEIIFVDGGSDDGSWAWLQSQAKDETVLVIQSPAGRARQMNAGANLATGDVLLFLHADTRLPNHAIKEIRCAVKQASWGRFDIKFSETDKWMKLVAFCMNIRSKLTGIATGDQSIFIKRADFEAIGGYQDMPIMEDVALSKELKKVTKPYCSKLKVITSARRWLTNGRIKTILLMWSLRWKYFRGIAPQELAKEYSNVR